jgi:hypothetical protein
VYVSDLSWEDKEVVLRLLFAKMNGLKRRKTQPAHGQGSPPKQSGASSNAPVFISEGAIEGMGGGDPYIEMGNFIDAFEVPLGAGNELEGAADYAMHGESLQPSDVGPGGIDSSVYGGYNLSRGNMA